MEKQTLTFIRDLMEFWWAALLFVIMSMLTKQRWIWQTKLIFIFVGCLMTWYFASGIPATFFPEMYNWDARTLLNWITTIVSFMLMLYVFEKNVFYEAFDFYKNKKIK